MSLDVLDQVWTAEMSFLRDMYLLDADFFRFVWGLLQQPEAAEPGTAALAVHAGTKVCLGACLRASLCVFGCGWVCLGLLCVWICSVVWLFVSCVCLRMSVSVGVCRRVPVNGLVLKSVSAYATSCACV